MRKVLATSLCLLFVLTARAELNIEITEGVNEAVPIAIVPFRWAGNSTAPFDVAGLIDADLERSGRFAPVDRGDMLESPSTGEEIDFDDWRLLGTDVIVVGGLTHTGDDNYSISFSVYDIFRQVRLVGYEIPANLRGLRRASHKVSDLIYEALTGVKGAFSTRVVYVSVIGANDDRTYQLVLADVDGENQTIILESPWPIMSPSWSPDGKRLAYVSFENDHSAVYVQVLQNGSRTRVAEEDGINGAPAWSPDGEWLALTLSRGSGNLDIFTLSLDDFRMIRVTDNPAIDTEAVWSPGGNSLLFTSDRSGGPQVYRLNIDDGEPTGDPRRISFEGPYNARPRISPDGKSIAVVHNDRGNYRIGLIDVRSGSLRVLTNGRLDESPSFAPNGDTIIYATRDGGRDVLATVSVNGRIHQRIASPDGDVREPVWSPFPLK